MLEAEVLWWLWWIVLTKYVASLYHMFFYLFIIFSSILASTHTQWLYHVSFNIAILHIYFPIFNVQYLSHMHTHVMVLSPCSVQFLNNVWHSNIPYSIFNTAICPHKSITVLIPLHYLRQCTIISTLSMTISHVRLLQCTILK